LAGARNSLLFRSTNGGQSWARLAFPRHFLGTVATVAIQPGNSGFYLAGLSVDRSPYAGAWFSEDAGRTWQQAEGVAGNSVEAVSYWAKDPARVVAATRDGVWLSVDSGRKWQRISAPWNHELRGVTAVAFDPMEPDVIYAGTTHLPWKTSDGGKTWSSIHAGMIDDSDVFSIFIDPAKPQTVLASACSGIYRSETGGAGWTKFQGIPSTHRRTHVVRQHPGKPDIIYAGTTLGLLKSVNGGANFRQVNNLHILSMAFDPQRPERLYLAAEGTGLWQSEDGGETVKQINEGFVSRRVMSLTSSQSDLYVNVIQDGAAGGVFLSSDGGRDWKLAASTAALRDNHITHLAGCPGTPSVLFAGNESRLMRSKDTGASWAELGSNGPPGSSLYSLACMPGSTDGNPALYAGTDKGLFRSANLGAAWQPAKLTTAAIRHNVQAIYTSPAAPRRMAVRTTQAVFVSEDAGATWRVLNILFPVSLIYDLAMAETAAGSFLLATAQGLYISVDGGKLWQRTENGLAPGTVSTLAVRPGGAGEVYAAQFGRVYRSVNGGRDWTLLPRADIQEATLRKLAFHAGESRRLLALTPDMGVFYLDLSADE
jgi:photosystem II stability/assembly factor-like uncharacterized protein